jgi:hypothetical protein
MRVSFTQLFTALPDGAVSPLRKARIRGIDLKPGLWMGEGISVLGVDIDRLKGRDLEVEMDQGVTLVKAVY